MLCVVVCVYATCHFNDKVAEDLSNIRSVNKDLAWCFCGDFNVVRRASERRMRLEALIPSLTGIFWCSCH